jgi:hypothetical protein
MKLSEKSLFAMEKVESLISIYETKRITVLFGEYVISKSENLFLMI